MTGSYRASVGHPPLIRVKKQNIGLVGESVNLTLGGGSAKDWHAAGTHGIRVATDADLTAAEYATRRDVEMLKVQQSAHFGYIETRFGWGKLNTTGSTDDWTELDLDIAKAQSLGVRLIIHIAIKDFGNTSTSIKPFLAPADIAGTEVVAAQNGWTTAIWRASNMDRWIAFFQRLATRIDNNPTVDGISWSESTLSLGALAPPDYSAAVYAVQLKRLFSATSTAFVRTNVLAGLNFLSSQMGGSTGLVEECYTDRIGLSVPDGNYYTDAIAIYRNEPASGEAAAVRDYRGLIPMSSILSSVNSLTGGAQNPTAAIESAQSTQVKYLTCPTFTSQGGFTFENYVSAINADPVLSSACPSRYTACDVS